MKKITLLIFLLTISIGYSQQQTFNVTFEPATVFGAWTTFENNDGDNALEIIANPVSGGINTTATVAKFTALDAGQDWAGTQCDHASLGIWILEAGNNTISIDVYKSVISDVGIKFVNSTDGTIFQILKPNTTTNAWETITYDISSFYSHGDNHDIDRLVVFPDFAPRSQDNIVYFDNITWDAKKTSDPVVPTCDDGIKNGAETGIDCGGPDCEPCAIVPPLFLDFETEPITADFTSFDGGAATVIPNPQGSGNVAQIVRDGGEIWAGAYLTLDSNPDFNTNTGIKMKVWTAAPIGTKISIKTEGGTGSGDKDAFTTVTSAWETLTYDFTGAAGDNPKLTFLFDFGNVGDGSATSTFLFDDIEQFNPSTAGVNDYEIEGLNAYPNPTNNRWTISTKNEDINSVEVFNMLGKRVISLKPNSRKVNIEASNLPAGIYVSKITTNSGSSTRRLIKN